MEPNDTLPIHLLAQELDREEEATATTPRKAPAEAAVLARGALCDKRYLVICPLAAGGMAEVYKAYDTRTNEPVALKILQQRHLRKDFVLEKTIAEGRVLKETDHDGLVKVFDYGLHEGVFPYYVMELLEGETLHEKIYGEPGKPRRGPVALADALEWMVQLIEVVHHLHTVDIIHRDLKPDNVFITTEGKVKGLDLSASKFGRLGLPTTQTGRSFGTPHYMCPEHIRGTGKECPAWDVYALGLITYEMLTGRYIFSDHPGQPHTNGELCTWHENRPRPSIRDFDPRYPPELDTIIQTAAAKAAAKRFRTAADMLAAVLGARSIMRDRGQLEQFSRRDPQRLEVAAKQRLALTTTAPTSSAYAQAMERGSLPPASVKAPAPVAAAPNGGRFAPSTHTVPMAAPQRRAPHGTEIMEGRSSTLPAAVESPDAAPDAEAVADSRDGRPSRAAVGEIFARVVAAPMRPPSPKARGVTADTAVAEAVSAAPAGLETVSLRRPPRGTESEVASAKEPARVRGNARPSFAGGLAAGMLVTLGLVLLAALGVHFQSSTPEAAASAEAPPPSVAVLPPSAEAPSSSPTVLVEPGLPPPSATASTAEATPPAATGGEPSATAAPQSTPAPPPVKANLAKPQSSLAAGLYTDKELEAELRAREAGRPKKPKATAPQARPAKPKSERIDD